MIWVRASVRRLWGDGGVIIAIDGPAGSGKGTLAQALGDRFGFAVLDTGLIYRAVGMKVLRDGANPSDVEAAVNAARHLRPMRLRQKQPFRATATTDLGDHVVAVCLKSREDSRGSENPCHRWCRPAQQSVERPS